MPVGWFREIYRNEKHESYLIKPLAKYRIEICGVAPDDFDIFVCGTEAAYEAWRVTCEFLKVVDGWGYLYDDETNELIERS